MLRILDRYVLREVLVSWFSVSGVLLAILITDRAARVLEMAAASQYPRGVVLQLIGLGAVQYLPLILPVGLLLGIVLGLGRLYHDSEMSAAQACGAGSRPILVPVLGFTAVLAGFVAVLSLQISPAASGRMLDQRREALRAGQFAPLSPGKFSTFGGGSTVVYAQAADPDGTLRRVFVQRSRGRKLEIALAQRATHAYAEGGDLQVITLYDGVRYEGIAGERKFRVVRFAENSIPVRLPALSGGAIALEGITSGALVGATDLKQRAELQWRIALPVMAVIMALIAIPLARLAPRQGRYARVGYAVLIFFVYINLMTAGKMWVAKGVTPGWLGLWWVHAVVALLAMGILFLPRWRAKLRYRRNMAARLVPA